MIIAIIVFTLVVFGLLVIDIVVLNGRKHDQYQINHMKHLLDEYTKEEKEYERIDKIIAERFDKHYATFEEFQKDILKKVEQALKDVEEGRYQSMDAFCAEMEEKYDLH